MRRRSTAKFYPRFEPLERKQPLSAGVSTAAAAAAGQPISANAIKPNHGYLVYRRTNPNPFNNTLIPPFGQVLVQGTKPVPGQVYNVLSVVVRNGTLQTFDAKSGFFVKLSRQGNYTPILTGNQQWKPGEQIVFYVLTKKYYPIDNQVSGGFQFLLDAAHSVAIPGPSGIFLRLTYNPATFARTLDSIVAFGQGAQGGAGVKTGMAVTNFFEFVNAKTQRNDYGGLF
jgi:hypothetical protein